MTIVKVKERFQVTLPLKFRRKLGIKKGDDLQVELRDNEIVLRPGRVKVEFVPRDQTEETEIA